MLHEIKVELFLFQKFKLHAFQFVLVYSPGLLVLGGQLLLQPHAIQAHTCINCHFEILSAFDGGKNWKRSNQTWICESQTPFS